MSPFPKKFKNKLELTKADLKIPDEAWLVYAVCGCDDDSCGWEGWMIESASQTNHDPKKQLNCMNEQVCPNCNKMLFRTDSQIKMKYSQDQSGLLVAGKDYDVVPMKYE
jgi:hypothetical protein